MPRSAEKVIATLFGGVIAFVLFMSMGMNPHFNADPLVLVLGALLLGAALFAGR